LKLYRHEASRGLFATAELLVVCYQRTSVYLLFTVLFMSATSPGR